MYPFYYTCPTTSLDMNREEKLAYIKAQTVLMDAEKEALKIELEDNK